jgi:hypothetical protein
MEAVGHKLINIDFYMSSWTALAIQNDFCSFLDTSRESSHEGF